MPTKKELEIFLSQLKKGIEKSNRLQQYFTPSNVAADLLWTAFMQQDLEIVADFGTGNGILAIGAKFLGAEKVYAIEKDPEMIELAKDNAGQMKIEFVNLDVSNFNKKVDTVIMNPPFGKKPKHLDREFLLKAFELSNKVYSIHTANSFDFLKEFAIKKGFKCEKIKEFDFPIKKTFDFHKKPVKNFKAVMLLYSSSKHFNA